MNKKEIEFHEGARAEALAAREWYSERSELVAARFVAEFERAIRFVQSGPNRWPGYVLNTRRFFLRGFPLRSYIEKRLTGSK